ncbi:hypothetical protein Daud_0094 [Candidatus Desulforudis audaxviator MP104C]|uniref:Uncharacterized protein n=1 Tax=Desulforudis audaxviator (strain MP104C) TaxID=477974 RepID=B1I1Q0_DESAP|nr:hypothetical protein Daud_0094 [Candidatus Desulforudis audaxviator MP104C]
MVSHPLRRKGMPLRLLQHNAAYLMLFIAPLTWGGGAFVAAGHLQVSGRRSAGRPGSGAGAHFFPWTRQTGIMDKTGAGWGKAR